MIYLVDIDGTLADCSHRQHFIQNEPKDWPAFFAACVDDVPIAEVVETIHALDHADHWILLVSGRSDECKDLTIEWLRRHHIPWDDLRMRAAGDHREDWVLKKEILHKLREEMVAIRDDDTIVAIEDRQQVVDMYRAEGLRVFQVAPGNF